MGMDWCRVTPVLLLFRKKECRPRFRSRVSQPKSNLLKPGGRRIREYRYVYLFQSSNGRRFCMKGLVLHCGGREKTRSEVYAVPVPEATATYVPLPFESFITRIEKQLAVEGISVVGEQFALSHNGERMFGLLGLQMP